MTTVCFRTFTLIDIYAKQKPYDKTWVSTKAAILLVTTVGEFLLSVVNQTKPVTYQFQ